MSFVFSPCIGRSEDIAVRKLGEHCIASLKQEQNSNWKLMILPN